MRRSVFASIFVIVISLLFVASSQAVIGGSSASSGAGAGPSYGGGGGGGGGSLMLNDIAYTSRDFNWSTSMHNDFFQKVKANATKSSPSARAQSGAGSKSQFFETASTGSSLNKQAWKKIAITNTCAVPDIRQNKGYGSKCRNADPNNHQFGKTNGWQEIHTDTPNGLGGVAGNPIASIVRVWRECPGKAKDSKNPNQISGYEDASDCTKPILERVLPESDHNLTSQSQWFYGYGSGDTYKSSTSSSKGVAKAVDEKNVGALYRSCASLVKSSTDRARYCSTGPSGGIRGATWDGGSSSSGFQKNCTTSLTGKWSRGELSQEIAYRISKAPNTADRAWFKANKDSLLNWAAKGNIEKFPPVANTTTEKRRICNSLSEWVNVNWFVPGNVSRKRAEINVRFNGIPGRIYAVQIATVDRSETILDQQVDLQTSPTTTSGTGTGGCIPTPCGCKDANGKVCDPVKPPKAEVEVPPVDSNGGPECDKAILVNDVASCTIRATPGVAPEEENNGGDETTTQANTDDNSASAWFPRAFGGGVYNRVDSAKPAWQSAYADNHPSRSFQNTIGGWGYGPIIDSTIDEFKKQDKNLYPSTNGMRGQGSLVNDGDGSLVGGYDVSVARATETPFRDNIFDANTPEAIKEHYRTEDIRYTELVGESIRPLGKWNTNPNNIYTDTKRLTSEHCSTSPREWADAEGITGSTDWTPRGCQAGPDGFNNGTIAGKDTTKPWRVKDAYYVPPAPASSETRDLAVNFTQEKDQAARLTLDDHGSNLKKNVVAIEIYKDRDYFEGGIPTYAVSGSADGTAVNANGQIRFCPIKKTIMVPQPPIVTTSREKVVTVAHSQKTQQGWNENGDFPGNRYIPYDKYPSFYNDDYFGGGVNLPVVGHASADIKLYRAKSTGILYDAPIGAPYTQVWGRSWWSHKTKKGGKWVDEGNGVTDPNRTDYKLDSGTYSIYKTVTKSTPQPPKSVQIDNPDCSKNYGIARPTQAVEAADESRPGYSVVNNKVQEKLPAGNYVIVYRVSFAKGFLGKNNAGGYWGITANLTWRKGKRWINGFTYQATSSFLPVYESRPVG